MSLFTASNGVVLDEHGDEYDVQLRHRKGDTHEARKEFYQQLRDKELGQTREGNIVVRPLSDNKVLVWDETTGKSERWYRREISVHNGVFGHDEAKRYFAAHPEPKPWHSATEGDLWEVDYRGFTSIALVSDEAKFVFTDKSSIPIADENITAGTRLWPEGDSDG